MIVPREISKRLAPTGIGRSVCRRARRGSLLAEVAMSSVLLMIAMVLSVRVLGWVGVERRAWDRRQWAAQEISNLMEEATSRPFEEVNSLRLKNLTLSTQAQALLPGAELASEVAENDPAGGPGSKRIAIRLRWRNRSGEWDAPVRLTSWIYKGRPQQ
jgi:hypothetical protein